MPADEWWDIVAVLKYPKGEYHPEEMPLHDIGIYPSGELMGQFWTEEAAINAKQRLEDDESERFDEVPYKFILSYREIRHE